MALNDCAAGDKRPELHSSTGGPDLDNFDDSWLPEGPCQGVISAVSRPVASGCRYAPAVAMGVYFPRKRVAVRGLYIEVGPYMRTRRLSAILATSLLSLAIIFPGVLGYAAGDPSIV